MAVINTQDFLGWYNHVDETGIRAMLDMAGHGHPDYVKEKVSEWKANRVLFAWSWYEDLEAYYKAEKNIQ